MTRRNVAVVAAGLGQPSSTRLLADRLAAATVHRAGPATVDVHVIELRELANDIAQNMVTGFPVPRLREAVDTVTSADGVIAVTPVFTASYNGLFKSFFDIVDKDALNGVPVLIAATGGTARHSLVLDHAMRPLFSYLRAVVVPTGVYAASEDWGAGGDDALAGRIDAAAGELAALVAGRPERPTGESDVVVPFAEQLAALSVANG